MKVEDSWEEIHLLLKISLFLGKGTGLRNGAPPPLFFFEPLSHKRVPPLIRSLHLRGKNFFKEHRGQCPRGGMYFLPPSRSRSRDLRGSHHWALWALFPFKMRGPLLSGLLLGSAGPFFSERNSPHTGDSFPFLLHIDSKWGLIQMRVMKWGFPCGNPVVKTPYFHCRGLRTQSLVRELRSCLSPSVAKIIMIIRIMKWLPSWSFLDEHLYTWYMQLLSVPSGIGCRGWGTWSVINGTLIFFNPNCSNLNKGHLKSLNVLGK